MVDPVAVRLPGDGVELEGLLFEPAVPSDVWIVFIPGWGDGASALVVPSEEIARRGSNVLSVSLRGFGGSDGDDDDCGLRQTDDLLAVLEWVHARAIDAVVGLLGISQGGQVALLAAARRPGAVDAVAAWSAVTDIETWREGTAFDLIRAYLDIHCADGRVDERSPRAQVDHLAGPVLLVHGDEDVRVPTEQSISLHRALTGLGRTCELELLPGVGHQRGRDGNQRALDRTLTFFDRHLCRPS